MAPQQENGDQLSSASECAIHLTITDENGNATTTSSESARLLSSFSDEEERVYGSVLDEEKPQQQQEQQQQHGGGRIRRSSSIFYDEVNGMFQLAVPVVGTYLLEMLPGVISIVLVGHIHSSQTEEYIDAVALAVMFLNLTGLSVGIGLSSAMDTLCSQAYGMGETEKMGTYLQTGFAVLSVFFVVVCALFYRSTDILLALGQPPEVADLAGTFTWYLLPGVPGVYLYELFRKVLQSQNIARPMFMVAIVSNLINLGLGYYLIHYTSWGWLGVAVARTVANLCLCLFLLPFLLWGKHQRFWYGFHLQVALKGIPEFLSLGIPGMLQLCFEWWAFELLALLCGWLPNAVPAIGANSIVLNIASVVYMFYLGLSISGNVRIGNALGAGQPERARLAANLTLGLSVLGAGICASFLLFFRTTLPRLFTHDDVIVDLASTLLYVSAAFQIPDSMNGAVQGVFRGCGRQSLGARLNFVAYYLVGIPLGCWLAFGHAKWGIVGLWVGITAGLCFVAVVGVVLISRSDWGRLVKEAQERIR